jgi:pilus assembly protein Flp/PilA
MCISTDGAHDARGEPERLGGHSQRQRGIRMRDLLRHFGENDQGAAAIEYALLAAGIAAAVISVVFALGSTVTATFSSVSSSLN